MLVIYKLFMNSFKIQGSEMINCGGQVFIMGNIVYKEKIGLVKF